MVRCQIDMHAAKMTPNGTADVGSVWPFILQQGSRRSKRASPVHTHVSNLGLLHIRLSFIGQIISHCQAQGQCRSYKFYKKVWTNQSYCCNQFLGELSKSGTQGEVPILSGVSPGLMLREVPCAEMAIVTDPETLTTPCSRRARKGLRNAS